MRISVIGCGYSGAVHAAAMASLGHTVVGTDVDETKVALLSAGEAPFYEPGLPEALAEARQTGRLSFRSDITAVAGSRVHFLGVGAPQLHGEFRADPRHVEHAFDQLLPHLAPGDLVVGKSTVPVGSAESLAARLERTGATLVWNPESLREGFAVADTLHPARLAYGLPAEDEGSPTPATEAARLLPDEVYAAPLAEDTPLVVTDDATAELVKVAANAFLATEISFINAMAELCEATRAEVTRRRVRMVDLAREVRGGSIVGHRVALPGAAFKPDSDDVRDSPAPIRRSADAAPGCPRNRDRSAGSRWLAGLLAHPRRAHRARPPTPAYRGMDLPRARPSPRQEQCAVSVPADRHIVPWRTHQAPGNDIRDYQASRRDRRTAYGVDRKVSNTEEIASVVHEAMTLVLGTADWDAPIATNQHHISAAIARSLPTLFVEGFGTRELRPNREDLKRVLRRLNRRQGTPERVVPDGLQIRSPRIIPSHGAITAAVNRKLMHRIAHSWREHDGRRVLVTYTPFTYDLDQYADVVIYHLVDLLHENPGVNGERIKKVERKLARTCTWALCTSRPIAEHLRRQGFRDIRVRLNVGDVAPFAHAMANRPDDDEREGVLFMGALSPWKLDAELLVALADAAEGRTKLTLVGPGTLGKDVTHALSQRGVNILDAMDKSRLADLAARSRVGIVPYSINALTQGISPLKTFEYLAAGMPVVSTPLPSIEPTPGAVHVASGKDFVEQVMRLATDCSDQPANRSRLRDLAAGHDWQTRCAEVIEMLEDSLSSLSR